VVEDPIPMPPGRRLVLPGRGTTFVRDIAGPPGAPTLLLLHGWTATADLNWFTSYRALEARFRVVAVDNRGHGRGLRSATRFSLEDCAGDAAAVCAELGIERVVPVGYSMGGPIAQLMWRDHRHLVAGLVLCATARRFTDGSPRARLVSPSMTGAAFATRFTPEPFRTRMVDEWARRMRPGRFTEWAVSLRKLNDPTALLQAGAALARFDSRSWSPQIDVPTAVLVMERDQVVKPHAERALADAIPGAAVYPVDGEHGVVLWEPDKVVPVLVRACADVAARAGLTTGGYQPA
jgi:3-oxoadipate enol-lactonase